MTVGGVSRQHEETILKVDLERQMGIRSEKEVWVVVPRDLQGLTKLQPGKRQT